MIYILETGTGGSNTLPPLFTVIKFPLHYGMPKLFVALSWFLNVECPTGNNEYVGGNEINVDLKEIGWERMDWIHLAQDRGM